MPLSVTFFDVDLMKSFGAPVGVQVGLASDVATFATEISNVSRSQENEDLQFSECASCENLFLGNESRVVRCPDCRALFHARCAAASFQKTGGISLMPAKDGQCPVCERKVEWAAFVRSAFIYQGHDVNRPDESDTSQESASSSSDSEIEVISPTPAVTSKGVRTTSSPVVAFEGSSLRERLFKKTGDSRVFSI